MELTKDCFFVCFLTGSRHNKTWECGQEPNIQPAALSGAFTATTCRENTNSAQLKRAGFQVCTHRQICVTSRRFAHIFFFLTRKMWEGKFPFLPFTFHEWRVFAHEPNASIHPSSAFIRNTHLLFNTGGKRRVTADDQEASMWKRRRSG